MPYANNITRLAELAAQAFLKAQGLSQTPSDNIRCGFDYDELPAPRIVCCVNNATPDEPADDAVWQCDLEIEVISNADEQKFESSQDVHHERAGEAFAQFFQGRYQTPGLINTAANAAGLTFGVQDILAASQTKEIQNRQFRSKLILKMICCGVNLS